MNRRLTRTSLAVALAAGLAAVGTAGALAAGGPPVGARASCTGTGPVGVPGAPLAAAADYLGLTTAQVRAEKQAGASLADVAAEQGKSLDGLVQAMVTAAKANLDKAVAAGRITDAQRTTQLAQLQTRIEAMVQTAGGQGPGQGQGRGAGMGYRGGR